MKVQGGSWVDELPAMMTALFLLVAIVFNLKVKSEQQFSYLARSFLAGKSYFLEMPTTWDDAAPYKGKYYRSSGLMPALILVPLVWVWNMGNYGIFLQGYMQVVLVLGIMGLVWVTSRRLGWSKNDSLIWSFAFCFSSVFLGVAFWSWGWQYAQVVTVFWWWLILALMDKKQYHWFVGVLLGLIFLTRSTAAFGVAFLFFEALRTKKTWVHMAWLVIPLMISVVITGGYNWIRFENFLESGQKWVLVDPVLDKLRMQGEFSLSHVPRNLFYSLINLPRIIPEYPYVMADQWGMSLFVMSPYLAYWIWKLKSYRDIQTVGIWVGVLAIFIPILMFFSTGYRQVGARYTLDFLPLIFWWCMKKLKSVRYEFSTNTKLFVLGWSVVNVYLFLTVYFKF